MHDVLERPPGTALGRLLANPGVGLALVAATCGLTVWFHLGGTTLWDPDEGRHASIASEMLASGQWLTPTLNGQPYHDKPVLFYWVMAWSLAVFGHDAWAARFPSALACTIGVLITTIWGMRFIGPLTGTVAGLILATAGLWVGLGRFALLDMLFSLWLSAALFYGSAWAFGGRERGWPVWPLYVMLALATLTKGPAAPVLTTAIFVVLTYHMGLPWRAWRPLHGAVVFCVVAGTWFLPAAIIAPQYVSEFIWTHNVGRFASGRVGHPSGVLAYFYWLPIVFLPWSLYWPGALHALRARGLRGLPAPIELCLIWVTLVFGFFTVSAAKLPTYMLPIFPPLALLTAVALGEVFRAEPPPHARVLGYRVVFHALQVFAVALVVASVVTGRLFWPEAILSGLLPVLLVVPLPIALGHFVLRQGRPPALVPATFLFMVLLLLGFYGWVAPWLNDAFSLATPARLIRNFPAARRVFTVDCPPASLSFYLQEPVQRLATVSEAAARLSEGEVTAIVTKRKQLAELAALVSQPAYVWWESPRIKVLVVNRPPPEGRGIPIVPLAARARQ